MPLVIYPPDAGGGRRVRIDGTIHGRAYSVEDVARFMQEAGLQSFDELDIVREGARRVPAAALEVEIDSYVAELADEKHERERRLVVRNGHHQLRNVTTAAETVEAKAPHVNAERIDEETGERKRLPLAIPPLWARKSPKISEVLPLLYLHGLSSGHFVPALEQFLGSSVGLSPATVTWITQWQADHKTFSERDLSATDYVYV